ncbi:Beta-ketoacyl-acyl-carrier-protein synthase I [Streptomyces sp. MA5143a]|nr:Beta-ketoacyl-acyl-carrier-protein synthase I [Streptomyces sp. MA5143a]
MTTFLELGPTPHLTSAVNDILDTTACVPTLRPDDREARALLTGVATLHTRGSSLDWPALLPGGKHVDLPTYAFQHQPYWLDTAPRTFDVTSAGLSAPEHPLLQSKLDLPGSGGAVFTGVISRKSQPWLCDHSIAGTVLMPGTGFVELSLHAAQETGYAGVDELIIEAPLVIPEHGAVQLQVAVQADGGLTVHSRSEGDDPGIPWTRHASGTLTTTAEPADFDLAVWPPKDARPLSLDAAYEAVAAAGYHYGPVFRGLTAAWTRGDEVFAEAALPEEHHEQAARYGIHPALLDTAFHASMLHGDHEGGEGRTVLPFAWNGVTLHAAGTPHIRVRVVRSGSGATTAQLADCTGAPVVSIRSVVARPAATDRLAAPAPGAESLYRVEWHKAVTHPTKEEPATVRVSGAHDIAELVAASADGSPVPELIVLDVARAAAENDGGTEGPAAVHALTSHVLSVVQTWLAEPALDGTRLLALTRGAVAVDAHDPVNDLAAAAVWGLLRAAQSEHPGRVVLVDVDDESVDQVPAALSNGEPQLALRGGTAYVPRFVRGATDAGAGRTGGERDTTPRTLDPDGTVLVTGGTGSLGALVARRLVTEHGVRHLVLTSRSGPNAPGAPELEAELTALGAYVRVEACDVTDRAALAALLDTIAQSAPLTAVVHTAGVLDDGVLTALTAERLSTVLRPKVDAAWHLHELTKDLDLAAFVLFSSVSGLMGGAGQGNYAAANAYLNALAHRRRTEGRAALTLAWGLWDQAGGMTSGLTETDRKRLSRGGLAPLGPDEGLALFDAALADAALRGGDTLAVPVRLDYTALRAQAADGTLPHLLHGLVRRVRRAATAPLTGTEVEEPLAARLAGLSADEQEEILQALIRSTAAQVLGLPAAESFPADAFFFEAGFDSLTAVELRNRLSEATAVRLSSTFVFDHPTPQLLAEQLRLELTTQEA